VGAVTLPLATTTITIRRPPASDDGADPYDAKGAAVTVATGVRAVFSSPAGRELGPTGSAEAVDWRLLADPCDLRHYDTVVDETTAKPYGVVWAKARTDGDGGLDHVVAGVDEIEGAA
jgi:hypothetical protein